jgi:uncharacterized protein (TIGR00730 family)
MDSIKKVCVFCASSSKVDKKYFHDAELLGIELARNKIHVIYGGGAVGLMGKLADSIIREGGMITGVIPGFMAQMKWAHYGLTELIEVKDMHERKNLMIRGVDAVVALPGGVGTLEELTEVITLKQLGQFFAPVIIVNTDGYFDQLIGFFEKMIQEKFMRQLHKNIWKVIEKPSDVLPAIRNSVPWDDGAIKFAAVED